MIGEALELGRQILAELRTLLKELRRLTAELEESRR